ncbi:DUF3575 domain-containing protein [Bacteroides sp. UBA939]|uniref:DUF3575 domain-containing protein n=1 Tax=Bacteroides sp. UBA939 TaxID=1946092 RepID=UPI0025BCF0C3|nr:DUF3575 domain-containing protein [Bacteroides sp. UBA939]
MQIRNKLLVILLGLFITGKTLAQESQSLSAERTIVFKFLSGKDVFWSNLNDNANELNRLNMLIDEFYSDIISGQMPVYVDGYCASLPTKRENIRTAFLRANRVKSELIIRKGLKEKHFITKNYVTDYNGHKDIVIVTIRIPAPKEEQHTEPEQEIEQEINAEPISENQQAIISVADTATIEESESQIASKHQEAIIPQITASRYIAIKTNLAAWAGTMLNAAIDIQAGKHISVELPVIWCPWHIGDSRSVRMLAFQPEARWWLSQLGQGHFFGVHASLAWYNVKWKNDRYQNTGRPLLGAGLSYGYLLPLGDRWASEFTLGAGYANLRYDTYYNIDDGARINTRTKNYWGITRIGISVAYRFHTNK